MDRPTHPNPAVQRMLDVIFWETPPEECMYCCTNRSDMPIPATRRVWFTLSGDMLLDHNNEPMPPQSICHPLCNTCAFDTVHDETVRPSPGMLLVADRPL